MKALLAIAAVLNLASCASYVLLARRLYNRAYRQGRKDEEKFWLGIERQVGEEREKIWREET